MGLNPLVFPRRGPTKYFLLLLVLCCSPIAGDEYAAAAARLGCHKRNYALKVTQKDQQGRACWDTVMVKSCQGRCDSNEISDYKFPYKKSFHPVCVYSGRVSKVATLANCDPDVAPLTNQYNYLEAASCKCQTCSSSDTSCEAPKEFFIQPHFGPGSSGQPAITEDLGEY